MKDSFIYSLSDENLWYKLNELRPTGGVYILKLLHYSKPKKIGRLLKNDPNGILYIGKCANFTDRVINLKKTICPKYNGGTHICGRRMKNIKDYGLHFPFSNLKIELIPSDTPKMTEHELIDSYFQEFGEVPPLNAMN